MEDKGRSRKDSFAVNKESNGGGLELGGDSAIRSSGM